MFMARLHEGAAIEISVGRSAEKRVLDVVHGEGVPAKKKIDISLFDQLFQMLCRAALHDGRTGHDENFPATLTSALEFAGRLPNHQALWLFDRYILHEFEDIGARGRTL